MQRGKGRLHHIQDVVAAQRLAQDIADAGGFDHGAHAAAGNDARAGAGRLEQHDACAELGLHLVRNRAVEARHADQLLLGALRGLADGIRHFTRLADADANAALLVTHHDHGAEGETTATLDDLGGAGKVDDAFFELLAFASRDPSRGPCLCVLAAALPSLLSLRSSLEDQAALTAAVGQCLDAAMIGITAAVEDHFLDALGQRTLGDGLADGLGLLGLA